MKLGKSEGVLLAISRRLVRIAVSPSLWPVVDDELQEELAERAALGWSRWRCAVWGTAQYLSVALRIAAERLVSIGRRKRQVTVMLGGGWVLDLKQALRALRWRPGTSFTVVSTVALAIGATTSVYSVVDGVLLRSLPYPEPDRLVRIWQTRADWMDSPDAGYRSIADRLNTNAPIYYDWLEADVGFESLGAYVDASFVLQGTDGAEVLRGQEVTSGLFATLAIEPIVGRGLLPVDDEVDAPGVVVLSEGFWKERLGGRRDALGTNVLLDGTPRTVIGVMPAGFRAPTDVAGGEMLPGTGPALWTPLTDEARRGNKSVSVLGRLEPGILLHVAEQRFSAVHAALVVNYPEWQRKHGVRLESLLDSVVGGVRSTLWFLLAAVGLVLAVATVNIANMLMALGLARRRELAVRSALGAGSGRLVRSLFVESAVLAALGGLGGILVAWISLPLLLRFVPATVPRNELIAMSPGVILFGIAVTGVTAFLVGTLPAILAARSDPQEAMRTSTRSLTSGRAASGVRAALVVAEVSLAFVLLVGAGLLANSYARLWSVERGFVTDGLAAMWVEPDATTHPTRSDGDLFRQTLWDRLNAIPGVSATAANNVPLSGLRSGGVFYVERGASELEKATGLLSVGLDNYMEVVGIRMLAGRGFERSDDRAAPAVAIVNQTMARRYWPGENVIGRRLRTNDDTTTSVVVVGVVADVRHEGLATRVEPKVYLPAQQSNRDTYEWILRIRGDVTAGLQQSREAVAALSPTTPVTRLFVLDETIADSVAIPRFRTFFILGLAGLAAVLALLGVYGVLMFTVTARTKEIGVRMALGARSQNVVRQVVGSGLRLAMAGIAVGLLVAWRGANLVSRFLFEIAPNDPATYVGIAVGLLAVSCMAAYLPARRAAAVDPVSALKSE